MRHTKPILTLLAVALLALAGSAAAAGSPPKVTEESGKFVLSNDLVQVWFQGKKPTLRVLPSNATGENATGAFTYRFLDVVEYRDLDGNGAPGPNEVVQSLNLDRADGWAVAKNVTDGSAVLNLTLTDDVKASAAPDLPKPPVGLPANRSATVGLTFTLRGEDASMLAGVANLTVRASAVKYDFTVSQWPFLDAANDRLALRTDVTGGVKQTNATGVASASVSSTNGTALGSLSWTTVAQGKTAAGGSPLAVPVRAAVEPQADATGASTGLTRVTFTYDAPGLASLVHDPTVGLFPAEVLGAAGGVSGAGTLKTPGPGLLLAAGAVGVAALALRRK